MTNVTESASKKISKLVGIFFIMEVSKVHA